MPSSGTKRIGNTSPAIMDAREVEEVCFGAHTLLHTRGVGKIVLLGQTQAGRYLFVVLASRSRREYRPVTARDMTDAERRLYLRQHGRR